MRHLLFPTDFSRTSGEALDFALTIAERYDAQLTVIHTYKATSSPRRPFIAEGTLRRQITESAKRFVKRSIHPDKQDRIHYLVIQGPVVETVTEASEGDSFDLLVLGRNVHYDWLTRLLGSKTEAISASAQCPVLIIPPNVPYQPFERVMSFDIYPETIELYNKTFPIDAVRQEMLFDPGEMMSSVSPCPYKKLKKTLIETTEKNHIQLCLTSLSNREHSKKWMSPAQKRRMILEMHVPLFITNPHSEEHGMHITNPTATSKPLSGF